MKITLPKSWTSTMLRITIKGYDYVYGGNTAWECVIGGYNTTPNTWAGKSAEIRGDGAPFSSIRLGHDGTNCCILLGTTSTTWHYPKIVISDVTGRSIWQQEGIGKSGLNQIEVLGSDLRGPGVYYYTLETPSTLTTKKMIHTQ